MPPADAELEFVLGSAGASPSLFKHALGVGCGESTVGVMWDVDLRAAERVLVNLAPAFMIEVDLC